MTFLSIVAGALGVTLFAFLFFVLGIFAALQLIAFDADDTSR